MANRRDHNSPLTAVNFICGGCRYKFASDPERIEDAPERHHPYLYFAECPKCGGEAEQVSWEKALMASMGKHTGPKTNEGKAAVTANLAGHPTPEEALRTRFNAMKHGLRSTVATYFPAKPGSYSQCKTCDIDWDECAGSVACMKRTELFMRHRIAFESRDPGMLTDLRADLQANIQAIIDDIILAIVSDGVALRNPAYDFDKDGGFHIAKYFDSDSREERVIEEIKAHPLLKTLSEFLTRNNMSLADFSMTPKVMEDNEITMGNLAEEKNDRETLLEYQRQQTNQLNKLGELIERSRQRSNNDPIAVEYDDG